MKKTQKARVVVVGGGFAGIEVIKNLRAGRTPVDITLISKNDNFQYYPALYKLVTGAIPIEVSVPLKVIFPKGVSIIKGVYKTLENTEKNVVLEDGTKIPYDYVVLALGSETNYFNIPGLPERSFSFKSVPEALRLKRHLCELFSNASTATREELVSQLHVVVVGGGPSGVELAGDLKTYLVRVAKEFKVDPSLITVDLVEAAPRLLPTFPEKVSNIADQRLRRLGVNILTNRALQSEDIDHITLKDMQLKTSTVIWTAGTKINPAFGTTPGARLDAKNRIAVSPWLTLSTNNEIFIAGDGAGTKYSGLAQTAIRDGAYIAGAIYSFVRGIPAKQYKEVKTSFVIPIGTGWAILVHNNFAMTGVLPWILRTMVDAKYFLSILPIKYVLAIFRKGRKYRHVYGGCALDEMPEM